MVALTRFHSLTTLALKIRTSRAYSEIDIPDLVMLAQTPGVEQLFETRADVADDEVLLDTDSDRAVRWAWNVAYTQFAIKFKSAIPSLDHIKFIQGGHDACVEISPSKEIVVHLPFVQVCGTGDEPEQEQECLQ